jgi:hypothetical protein
VLDPGGCWPTTACPARTACPPPSWTLRIGDVVIWITVDPSGHARQLEVYTPHDPTATTDPQTGRHTHLTGPDLTWLNPARTPPKP